MNQIAIACSFAIGLTTTLATIQARSETKIGGAAPNFQGVGVDGKKYSLDHAKDANRRQQQSARQFLGH